MSNYTHLHRQPAKPTNNTPTTSGSWATAQPFKIEWYRFVGRLLSRSISKAANETPRARKKNLDDVPALPRHIPVLGYLPLLCRPPPAPCSQGTSSLLLQQRQRRPPLRARSSSCRCAMSRTSQAPPPCLLAPMAAEARAPHPLRWWHAPSTCATPCAATWTSRPPPWRLQSVFLLALSLNRSNRSSQGLPRWLCMVRCKTNTVS